MYKECIECLEIKNIEDFVVKRNLCKNCMKEYKKLYHIKNKVDIRKKKKNYYNSNKEDILEKRKEYYCNNRDSKLEYQKEYVASNKDRVSEYKIEYQRNRRKTDPMFKLKHTISNSIRKSLKVKGVSKSKKTIDILGCDIEFLKLYLESLFSGEMSWENYGIIWDIDHIIPLSSAITQDDLIRLNHYTNLQPLDSFINRNIKRDRIDFYD
jgi:uncharacterized protein YbcC (UPF0753/DUF2309 family)